METGLHVAAPGVVVWIDAAARRAWSSAIDFEASCPQERHPRRN